MVTKMGKNLESLVKKDGVVKKVFKTVLIYAVGIPLGLGMFAYSKYTERNGKKSNGYGTFKYQH